MWTNPLINMYWYEDEPIQPNPGAPVPEIVQRMLSMKEGEFFVYLARSEPHKEEALRGVKNLARVLGWLMSYAPVREGNKRGFQVTRCSAEQAADRLAKPGLFAPELTVTEVIFPAQHYEAKNKELDDIEVFMQRVEAATVGTTLRLLCPAERSTYRQTVMRRSALQFQKELSFRQVNRRKSDSDGCAVTELEVTVRAVRKPIRHVLPSQLSESGNS